MTNIIARVIDLSAPGSDAERERVYDLMLEESEGKQLNDYVQMRRARRELRALVKTYLRTDDGSDLDEALAQISARQYELLVQTITGGEKDGNAVPIVSENS